MYLNMKYLKRFNEELNPMTYRRAAKKLDDIIKSTPSMAMAIDAKRRSDDLKKHSLDIEKKQYYELWKKQNKYFGEFGEFDFIIDGSNEPFYIVLVPEIDSTIESWEDYQDKKSCYLSFAVGLIPVDDEQYQRLIRRYDAYNGFIWGFWAVINYDIINSEVQFKGIDLDIYEIDDIQVGNRKTANKLKKLLIDILSDKEFYPSGHTDVDNMYDKIERDIIQGLNISIDYGIDMDRIKNDISRLNYMNFFIGK